MAGRLFRVGSSWKALVVVAVLSTGCTKTFRNDVVQPNPLVAPTETLRSSEPILIVTGDMDLTRPQAASGPGGAIWRSERYPLKNVAQFVVISRDRLRFHVQLEHKWKEYAHVSSWNAYLLDDRGRKYIPATKETVSDKHVVEMWDYETRSTNRNGYGDITSINDDGYKRREPLGSLSLFRGRGDFVFFHPNIFTSDIKTMTLHLERSGVVFEFTWRFADPDSDRKIAQGPAVATKR